MGGPPTPLPPHYHPTSTTAGLPPLLPMAEPAAPTSAAFTPQVYCVQWSGDSSRIASAGQESLAGLGPLRGVMPSQPQPYNLTPSLTSNLTPTLTPSLILSSSLILSLPRHHLPIISQEGFVLVTDPLSHLLAIPLRSPSYLLAISPSSPRRVSSW